MLPVWDRYSSFDLTSLSSDGSRIALLRQGRDETHGDVARDLLVNVVLDTRSGEAVDLPLDGRKLRQAYFQVDGSLVARVVDGDGFALVLISADGRKISETAEPAQFKNMQILAVTN
ncbi:hypothetical protein [Micromonospora thermarum]|uniref:Uncharacterized protein n=1 Tax=Micromonospora thermarum TaxID=2720024 RepID=A0ABX0Z3H7_9ACTN|nr:hypothetical protein [Micromonospora thermarum]NJP30623.1 hypothetical protein [Micromonospora thermarum]